MVGGGDDGDSPTFDRVMLTAGDLPVEDTLPALVDPAADHLDPDVWPFDGPTWTRNIDGSSAFLQALGYEAVVLTRADSIAWFTGRGRRHPRPLSRKPGLGRPVHQRDDPGRPRPTMSRMPP